MRIQFGMAAAAMILTFASDATAGIITISFDALASGEDVLEYYDGGSGSLGSGPGPAMGVSFLPGWIVSPPDVYSTPGGKSVAFTGSATINFHQGWAGITSFYYLGSDLTVSFYDAEDGLGNLLDTLSLHPSATFLPAGGDVSTLRSAVFTSTGGRIDALTNGAQVIPEPAGFILSMIGLAVVRMLRMCRPNCRKL
jgi:hypothetical protein